MSKIKGWKLVKNSYWTSDTKNPLIKDIVVYRTYYNPPVEIVISKLTKNGEKWAKQRNIDAKKYTVNKYSCTTPEFLGRYDNKQEAIQCAIRYMKKHLHG